MEEESEEGSEEEAGEELEASKGVDLEVEPEEQ